MKSLCRRPHRLRAVLPAIGVLVLVVGYGLETTRDVPATSASAATGHVESGTPGPDSVTALGAAAAVGGTTLNNLNAPVVGVAATPNGLGYWVVAADGGVFAYGTAAFEGSAGGIQLNAPVVGMAATPDGGGYWLVASDGGVFAYGDAVFEGSAGGIELNAPVVGMAATPDGRGYWLVASDGGVFAYGDAVFAGSMGGRPLNQPIVGMAATPTGDGYWLTAADGGIFAFGDAPFEGSMGGRPLDEPVVGMAASPDGGGYWLAAADGGVFNFGDAPFEGSDAGTPQEAPAVGIAGRSGGYWIAYGVNVGTRMISAIAAYVAGRDDNVTVAVQDLTTGQIYQFRPGVVENTASTLKVDILATLLVEAQAAGRPLTSEEQSLAVPMIEDSLDSAADTLWSQLGPAAIGAFEREAGMTSTVPATDGVWGTTTTTALDRLAMIRTLVEPNSLLTDASRAYVLDLMENITPSQDWGATGGVPPGVTVALKNGFAVINGWQINTTGWVDGAGRDYLIAVLTNGNASEQYGIDTVNAVSALVWNAFGP
jgi:Beta-lactamase enzyme family